MSDTPTPWYVRAAARASELRDHVAEKVDPDAVLEKLSGVIEVGSDAAEVISNLRSGVTVPGVAAVALRAVDSVRRHRLKSPGEVFASWHRINMFGLEHEVHAAWRADPGCTAHRVSGLYERLPAYRFDAEGFSFAARGSSEGEDADDSEDGAVWAAPEHDVEEAARALGRMIWRRHSAMSLLIRQYDGRLICSRDTDDELLPSGTAEQLYADLKPLLDKGIHRSVLAVGSPGTGKSSAVRYIASLRGGLRLRIKVSDLFNLDPENVASIVRMLCPDVLLIDDFDRLVGRGRNSKSAERAGALLDPITEIHDAVPLFMATANYVDEEKNALFRPGRFDKLIHIEKLDAGVYERVLEGAPDALVRRVIKLGLPIAHVLELRRRAVESNGNWKRADKELAELSRTAGIIMRVAKRKRKTRQSPDALTGKTPRQKARILEQRAAKETREALKKEDQGESARARAEKLRVKAEALRQQAAQQDAKKKTAKKRTTAKKKTAKKKRP